MKTQFPKTMTAFKTYANDLKVVEGKDLWAVGDGLVADIATIMGQPVRRRTPSGKNDGSYHLLGVASQELAENGYQNEDGQPYSVSWLRHLSEASETFPKSRRHSAFSVNLHMEAGNPDMLDWMVKHKPAKAITIRTVRMWRTELAERAARKARASVERGETREAPPTPRGKDVLPPSDDEAGPTVLAEIEVLGMARQAKRLANDAAKELRAISLDLDPATVDNIVEHIRETMNAWQEAYAVASKTLSKRGRLSVVGGD